MKPFSLKILLFCILAPPLLYITTFQLVEKKIQAAFARDIEEIYIGDTRPLFEGSITLEDAIDHNIKRYLNAKRFFSWGVEANVTVTTRQGTILFPSVYREASDKILQPPSSMETAETNYALLSQGLTVSVDLELSHLHLLSIAILTLYVLSAVLVFYFHYQAGLKKIKRQDAEVEQELERLSEKEQAYRRQLNSLSEEKDALSTELETIRQHLDSEREKAIRTEDEMIEEIVSLEEKLRENIKLQQEQKIKIEALSEKAAQFEKDDRKAKKSRLKATEVTQKRFQTLYKNIIFHDKAVSGFTDLIHELQLKSEEVILQLNEDPQKVPVKRKVFGKKNRETVFEVIFAYKGRLYYRKNKENKIEILSIGTKHTQTKDLQFLDNL